MSQYLMVRRVGDREHQFTSMSMADSLPALDPLAATSMKAPHRGQGLDGVLSYRLAKVGPLVASLDLADDFARQGLNPVSIQPELDGIPGHLDGEGCIRHGEGLGQNDSVMRSVFQAWTKFRARLLLLLLLLLRQMRGTRSVNRCPKRCLALPDAAWRCLTLPDAA